MTKVHVLDLYGRQFWRSSLYNWYPIYLNEKLFKESGIDFVFFPAADDRLFDCDVLFLTSSHFMWTRANEGKVEEFLSKARPIVKRIIWFDCADSPGNNQFGVLPFVDRYLKKQLYRDRSYYSRKLFFNNVAADFIHTRFSPADSYWVDKPPAVPLAEKDYGKIGISWNLGAYPTRAGAPRSFTYWASVVSDFFERSFGFQHRLRVEDPLNRRPVDIFGVFGVNYPSETISFQRKYALEILENLKGYNTIAGSVKIPRHRYWRLLRSSKIALSFWGWGEICVREMEGFIAGAAVIAPDMGHLETWPDLYIPYETYCPVKWDLSNLIEACETLLADDKKRLHLAVTGQRRFMNTWSLSEKEKFVGRMVHEIKGG